MEIIMSAFRLFLFAHLRAHDPSREDWKLWWAKLNPDEQKTIQDIWINTAMRVRLRKSLSAPRKIRRRPRLMLTRRELTGRLQEAHPAARRRYKTRVINYLGLNSAACSDLYLPLARTKGVDSHDFVSWWSVLSDKTRRRVLTLLQALHSTWSKPDIVLPRRIVKARLLVVPAEFGEIFKVEI